MNQINQVFFHCRKDRGACTRWTGVYKATDTTNQQRKRTQRTRTANVIIFIDDIGCYQKSETTKHLVNRAMLLLDAVKLKEPPRMNVANNRNHLQTTKRLDHDANLKLTLYSKDGVEYFISNKNKTKQLNISFENRNVDVLQHGQALPI